ncbi:hypothetical protein ACCO45_007591 [Purpureocillium lilacinum]|uniref:Uncharacterized protein n=1 Tax=Purpureocillium lilacinum TaxID=33203 RepID=A0ACC4DLM6_PURLI
MSGASINSAMDAAYYVDKQTGFVPRQMTLQGLPEPWDIWEATLDGLKRGALMHNDSVQFLDSHQRAREELKAKAWRRAIEEMPALCTKGLARCERYLRRARHVLAFLVQIHAHTIPSADPVVIPRSLFWVWQGAEDVEGSTEMLKKTSTPTAAQSPLIPALDAYLGLDESEEKAGFLNRVSAYMIRQHQTYLQEIRSGGRPIRTFVEPSTIDSSGDPLVVSEYNAAAAAIKRFRDAHLMIVSKYIIVPDRKAKPELTRMGKGAVTSAASGQHREGDNQGVGKPAEVASLIATLKAFRDQAAAMLIE